MLLNFILISGSCWSRLVTTVLTNKKKLLMSDDIKMRHRMQDRTGCSFAYINDE